MAKVADFASFTSEVKVLAVYNQERLEGYPDVPTMGELGYYDQWLGSSRCIVAPAGVTNMTTPTSVFFIFISGLSSYRKFNSCGQEAHPQPEREN